MTEVNQDLIDKDTYEPNVKNFHPRKVINEYGIPYLEYYEEKTKFQKDVSIFKDFIIDD